MGYFFAIVRSLFGICYLFHRYILEEIGGRMQGCACRGNGCVLEIRLPVRRMNTRHAGVERARHHAAGRVWVVCFPAPGAPRLCGEGLWSPPSCAGSRLGRVLLAVVSTLPPFFVVLFLIYSVVGLFLVVPSMPRARCRVWSAGRCAAPRAVRGVCYRLVGFPL